MGDEKVPAGTTFLVNAGDAAAPETDNDDDKESNGT